MASHRHHSHEKSSKHSSKRAEAATEVAEAPKRSRTSKATTKKPVEDAAAPPAGTIVPQFSCKYSSYHRCFILNINLPKVPAQFINFECHKRYFHLDTLGFSRKFFINFRFPDGLRVSTSVVQADLRGATLKATLPVSNPPEFVKPDAAAAEPAEASEASEAPVLGSQQDEEMAGAGPVAPVPVIPEADEEEAAAFRQQQGVIVDAKGMPSAPRRRGKIATAEEQLALAVAAGKKAEERTRAAQQNADERESAAVLSLASKTTRKQEKRAKREALRDQARANVESGRDLAPVARTDRPGKAGKVGKAGKAGGRR
jgi:hypothetical protein